MEKAKNTTNTQEEDFFETEAGKKWIEIDREQCRIQHELADLDDMLGCLEGGWIDGNESEISQQIETVKLRKKELLERFIALFTVKRNLININN